MAASNNERWGGIHTKLNSPGYSLSDQFLTLDLDTPLAWPLEQVEELTQLRHWRPHTLLDISADFTCGTKTLLFLYGPTSTIGNHGASICLWYCFLQINHCTLNSSCRPSSASFPFWTQFLKTGLYTLPKAMIQNHYSSIQNWLLSHNSTEIPPSEFLTNSRLVLNSSNLATPNPSVQSPRVPGLV